MTSPATLSLADLAAAVVRLGAHRVADSVFDAAGDQITLGHVDLLLAAANRLPAVVADLAYGAEAIRLRAELTTERDAHQATRDELRRLTKAYEAMTIEERLLTTERARLADALARGRAEVARLRGLVERACDALDSSTPDWGTGPKTWRSDAIRKEAAGE